MPGFIEGIFEKGIEGWQLDIIYDALADECKYIFGGNKTELAFEIGVHRNRITEILNRVETRELASAPVKIHGRHRDTLIKITKYLMDKESSGRLSKEHLKVEEISHLMPSVLTSYFNPDWDKEDYIDTGFVGKFIEWHDGNNPDQKISILSLTLSSDKGYYKVHEITTKKKYFAKEKDYMRDSVNAFCSIYIGWGILTSNGGLLVILKSKATDDQKIYINNFSQIRKKGSNIVSELIVIKISDLVSIPGKNISDDNGKIVLDMHRDYIKFVSGKDFSCSEIDPHDITDNGGESIEDRVLESFKDDSRFSHPSLANNKGKGKILMDEDSKNKLGDQLIRSVLDLDKVGARKALEDGASINFVHTRLKLSAIQIAASHGDHEVINEVLLTGEWGEECDLLVRDKKNLLPSARAGTEGYHKLAETLRDIEQEQGARKGISPRWDKDEPLDDGPGF